MDSEIIQTQTERILRVRYKKEIGELRRFSSSSFTVDYKTITNNDLATLILNRKSQADKYFEDALLKIGVEKPIVDDLTIRYINLPSVSIRDMKSSLVGQTRSFEGIVRRVSEVKSKATVACFECINCTYRVKIPQSTETIYPEKCDNCGKTKWKVVAELGEYVDYQTIIVQEFPESVSGGDQPKSITITLTGDITALVIPGNRVNIVGTIKLKKIKSDSGLVFEPFVEGNSVLVKDENYDNITISEADLKQITDLSLCPDLLTILSSSIAPTVYGNVDVKKGICLQLFGGVPKTISNTRIRGDIHVLLIGDPGIAKSVIMKHVVSLMPRGVFTHGYSSSKAGLTATAIKDEDGQWVLEAGALVLASGGLCAVDEIDKMQDNDREALHGAMEQQEIDIAKAGIVAKLYTRCSLLAAANPKLGRFDMCQGLSQQFNLAPTLLSRFDLIYPLTDTPEANRDSAIADYILNTHTTQEVKETVPYDLLRKYIAYARNINPKLTKEAALIIKDYYTKVRGLANNMQTVPITARSLEALIRLSEAAARLRLSSEVTVDDAELVVTIVDTCLRTIAYDSKTNTWDIDKVVCRYPKKSRDIISRINDAIITLSDAAGVASVGEVTTFLNERYHVATEDALTHIELMHNESRLYYPKNGYVKLLSKEGQY